MVSVGNKVIYHSDYGDIIGQVQRVFKHKVQILTPNFEKISAPIDDVEIAPLPKKFKPQEQATPAPTLDIAPPAAESSAKSSGGFKIGDRIRYTKDCNLRKAGDTGRVTEITPKWITVTWDDNQEPETTAFGTDRIKFPFELLVFGDEELDEVIAQIEEEKCSHSLTCAAELEPDFPSPDCNLDSTSLDSQKLTNTAQTSLVSDFQEFTTTETCDRSESPSAEKLASSQTHPPVSPSQFKETDSEPQTNETVSQQSLKQLNGLIPSFSRSKTSLDCLTAPGDQVMDEGHTSTTFSVTFPRAGTMQNGSWSAAAILERPGLGSDCCWLESPGALSSIGKARPPGLSRLEGQLKKIAALAPGEVLNPEFLEQSFSLDIGWTDPQDGRSALAFLQKMAQCAIAEPPSVTPLTQESQLLPCAESSTLTLLSVQAQNPPELKKGRAISFGWTSTQLLAGLKICTRRTWKDSYAKYFVKAFNEGRTIPAIDKDYRYGGKVIGHLRLTCPPYKEKLSDMPESDLEAEGGMCPTVDQFIKKYFKGDDNLSVWVIRFEFQPLDRSPSVESSTCPSCEAPLLKLDDGCGTCGWQPDNQHRSQQPQNPPELKQPRASGWLESYIKNKKLKSGIVASYPRAEGDRNPDDPHHWYWAYKYEEKSEKAISNNGCITRAVSVPAAKVLGVKNAIANRQPVQKVLQFIRGEINS